jgi:hypothetical protein
MDYFGVTIGNNGLPAGINHLEGVEGSIAEGLDYTYLYGEYPDYLDVEKMCVELNKI